MSLTLTLIFLKEKKGNVLFNDTLNTFDLHLYGIGMTIKKFPDGLAYTSDRRMIPELDGKSTINKQKHLLCVHV